MSSHDSYHGDVGAWLFYQEFKRICDRGCTSFDIKQHGANLEVIPIGRWPLDPKLMLALLDGIRYQCHSPGATVNCHSTPHSLHITIRNSDLNTNLTITLPGSP
jgi:hypothetical protein